MARLAAAALGEATNGRFEIKIWNEFVEALLAGNFPDEKIRPYDPARHLAAAELLDQIRRRASHEELEKKPEVNRVGDHVHYLLPLTAGGSTDTYCFTLLVEQNEWYFRHMGGLFLRLDEVTALPTVSFPDLPESVKAWVREEIAATEQVRLFNLLDSQRGREAAFDWFRDGDGYFLAARTWVPLVPPWKAFLLYVCWEQANLRGSMVTLDELTEASARVNLASIFLHLYERTVHLKLQISHADYQRLFETVWHDRARAAGWGLEISYQGNSCVFRFRR
jgi:hypothetical protein